MRLATDRGLFFFGVASALGDCLPVATDDPAASPAPAAPRVADPSEPVAAKLSVRLPETYGANRHSVKGQAA